jgi:two-component system, NtrC family, response regulator PilR
MQELGELITGVWFLSTAWGRSLMANVLVVDDDPDTLITFERILQLAGHNVKGARTGRSAFRTLSAFAADVALVDLKLPDISGIRILQQLRQQFPHTACVVVTGFGSQDDAIEALRAGAVDWLDKPAFNR